MKKDFAFDSLRFIREQRTAMAQEWAEDPHAFWTEMQAFGEKWRAELADEHEPE